jgi:hypothetical protein
MDPDLADHCYLAEHETGELCCTMAAMWGFATTWTLGHRWDIALRTVAVTKGLLQQPQL